MRRESKEKGICSGRNVPAGFTDGTNSFDETHIPKILWNFLSQLLISSDVGTSIRTS